MPNDPSLETEPSQGTTPEAQAQDAKNEIHQMIADLSRQGYHQLKTDHVGEAIQSFREILTMDPENNYALVGLGDSYRKKNRYHEACQYYQRCLDQHPTNNYALFGLADCYRNLKQFHRAIEVWEEYLKIDDKNVTVLTRVADAYRKVRNQERSRDLYLQVLTVEPSNAYAIIGLGHLYYDFKDYNQALDYWKRMLEIAGANVDIRVLTSLGNCHRKLKSFPDGIPFFQQALDRDDDNFYALFGLADCYRGMNMQTTSLDYWNRILDHDPDNKIILTRAGDAYRKIGQLDHARAYYERALNAEYDIYAILGLSLVSKLEGKWQQALKGLENLLEADRQLQRLYPDVLECYLALGDRQGMQRTIERFHALPAVNPAIAAQFDRIKAGA